MDNKPDSKMEDAAKADSKMEDAAEPTAGADGAEPKKQFLLDRIATSDGFKDAKAHKEEDDAPEVAPAVGSAASSILESVLFTSSILESGLLSILETGIGARGAPARLWGPGWYRGTG